MIRDRIELEFGIDRVPSSRVQRMAAFISAPRYRAEVNVWRDAYDRDRAANRSSTAGEIDEYRNRLSRTISTDFLIAAARARTLIISCISRAACLPAASLWFADCYTRKMHTRNIGEHDVPISYGLTIHLSNKLAQRISRLSLYDSSSFIERNSKIFREKDLRSFPRFPLFRDRSI